VSDCFADMHGVPEVAAAELRDSAIAAALQHHGALIVRGLLPRDVAGSLLSEIRRAFDAAEAACEGTPVSHTSPWYVPFEPAEGYDFGWVERHFSRQVGAVLAVEAPRVLFHAIEALEGSGVVDHIAGYLGERPALSAKKTSLRRAGPDSPTEWHQDGSFLGEGIRTVNVWTALTPCGQDAPSIDVFARPFEEIVATGTDDALFDWSVSEQAAQRLERNDVVRPVFEPGDALLFNQLTLHRTGIESTMSQERYALESWFFAPSTYPHEQVPVGL
jgi:Phytanoyl-CoA dioxygenase (PhyH)